MNYKILITLKKLVKHFIIAFVGVVAAGLTVQYPAIAEFNVWSGMTVFVLLEGLADWLKHRWGIRI